MGEEVGEQLAAHQSALVNGTPSTQVGSNRIRVVSSSPIDIDRYIPLGCFVASAPNDALPLDANWNEIDAQAIGSFNIDLGKQLISLTSKYWIRVFAKRDIHNHLNTTLRVYLLPDDVGRVQIPRTERKLRACVRFILARVDRSSRTWMGEGSSEAGLEGYHPEAAEDDSLFYIFNTLESPRPQPDDVKDYYAAGAMLDLLEGGKAEQGLKTELYQFQRRSCAQMIQRETQPELRLDQRLETLIGPTNVKFYLDRNDCEVLSSPRSYQEARGGILAESMGYGKTLICLATIIATKGRLPETPPEFSASVGGDRKASGPRSLVDTCALSIAKTNTQWKLYFQDRAKGGEHFDRCMKVLRQTIGRYKVSTIRGSARRAIKSVQTIYLASTTLVIVPANLLKQWQRQIQQHVRPGTLSILHVDDPSVVVRDAEVLRSYDLVLMSSSRFEEEMLPLGGNRANSDAMGCTCAKPAKRRFCHEHVYRSPLRDVHFLRVIVDEGERFVSGSTTQAVMALKALRVDGRWIVSGTPAGGLVGAEVGLAAEESNADVQLSEDFPNEIMERHALEPMKDDGSGSSVNESEVSVPSGEELYEKDIITNGLTSKLRKSLANRQKAKNLDEERKSIERLGHIVKSFLQVKPWANDEFEDSANWSTYTVPNKNGTRKPLSLRSVLDGLVVRHQYDDVERDLRLPPLENKLIRLRPCFFDKLSLNLFILALTVNAVTSERKDQDYMFHPRNRKSLEILIRNLRHAGFTWSGFTPEEIEKTCIVSQKYLEKEDGVVIETDKALLEDAITVGFLAQYTRAWRAFNQSSEIGLFVAALPPAHKQSLALCPEVEPRHDPCLLGATQLCSAQEGVEAELYTYDIHTGIRSLSKTKPNGTTNNDKKSQHSPMLQDSPKKSSGPGKGIPQSGVLEVKKITASQFSNVTARTRHRPLTVTEEEAMLASQRLVTNGDLKSILRTIEKKPDIPQAYPLLSKPQLIGTSSAKLSYLVDKVYGLYKTEKILIFYEGDDIAFYCAQVFELLGIPHLIYARGISQKLLNEYQTMFNTGSIYRVLLMDLKLAARGLHLASASRVFFINPVWQPDTEAQAIKRAHRIGQTRPVFVETLVLEGTIEEQMLQRRKDMSADEHRKAQRSLLDDTPMKDLIQNATLLPISPEEINDHSSQLAPLREPQQLFARSIVSAYGSHENVLEALAQVQTKEREKAVLANGDGLNHARMKAAVPPEEVKVRSDHHPRPESKKRKLAFVDELERRKVVSADRNGSVKGPGTAAAADDNDGPATKRKRSSKIVFADERNLPLSTTFILPEETESPANEPVGEAVNAPAQS